MNKKFLLPRLSRNTMYIGGAVGLALLAALISVRYVQNTINEKTRDDREMVGVAVPTYDIPAGSELTKSDLAVRQVPLDFVPADVITPENVDQYIGRILKTSLRQGVPLSAAATVAASDQFSNLIPDGKVAYTLSVDENNSINGMAAPGDLIDIFMLRSTGDVSTGGQGTQAIPLLQKIRVLATGTRLGERVPGSDGEMREDLGYATVTLEVEQRQAQRLAVADKAGELRVVLRKRADESPGAALSLTEEQLLRSLGAHDSPGRAHRTVAARARSIEFIVGGGG